MPPGLHVIWYIIAYYSTLQYIIVHYSILWYFIVSYKYGAEVEERRLNLRLEGPRPLLLLDGARPLNPKL